MFMKCNILVTEFMLQSWHKGIIIRRIVQSYPTNLCKKLDLVKL